MLLKRTIYSTLERIVKKVVDNISEEIMTTLEMTKVVDFQAVVKHIVNGSFRNHLCRICLMPLGECYEDVFTKVCKADKEFCIADILEEVCKVKIIPCDKYKVCSECFLEASTAYKFYQITKRTEEILKYYIEQLEQHIGSIDVPSECSSDSICIKMPKYLPQTKLFDFNIAGLCADENNKQLFDVSINETPICKKEADPVIEMGHEVAHTVKITPSNVCDEEKIKMEENEKPTEEDKDEDIVIVMNLDGEPSFFKTNEVGSLVPLSSYEASKYYDNIRESSPSPPVPNSHTKKRRKRNPMDYKTCSQCPVKYRFVAKLKEHMKTDHNIDIFVCKVCKAIFEDDQEFNNHLKTHTNIHICSICNAVFKKRETIIAHFRSHEAMKQLRKAKGARVCEICGWILKDEASLKEHHEDKHMKKYTCYYCGRMYKGEISFEVHIKKHEAHMKMKQKQNFIFGKQEPPKDKPAPKKRKFSCSLCARSFVDERSLMWHERLHTDERPYVCEVCGRAFVSVNRRNQHALCAHTAPARRCPLCPALFHLRSMVNSHIKKVHLQTHKRRNRTSKHQNVFWKTEPVPFQELSVAVQNDILELKTAQKEARKRAEAQVKQFSVHHGNQDFRDADFLETYCRVNVSSAASGSLNKVHQ